MQGIECLLIDLSKKASFLHSSQRLRLAPVDGPGSSPGSFALFAGPRIDEIFSLIEVCIPVLFLAWIVGVTRDFVFVV